MSARGGGIVLPLFSFLFCTVVGFGGTVSYVGSLAPDDPNDALLLVLNLPVASDLTVQSWGYGGGVNAAGTGISPGGFDPYLSLFSGSGPSAAFLASNDDGGCPPGVGDPNCRDPRLDLHMLAAGTYTLAVTTFGNISFAENDSAFTLGDGFVGLGSYFDWDNFADRTSAYAIDVDFAVPEPSTGLLVTVFLAGAAWRFKRRAMRCSSGRFPVSGLQRGSGHSN